MGVICTFWRSCGVCLVRVVRLVRAACTVWVVCAFWAVFTVRGLCLCCGVGWGWRCRAGRAGPSKTYRAGDVVHGLSDPWCAQNPRHIRHRQRTSFPGETEGHDTLCGADVTFPRGTLQVWTCVSITKCDVCGGQRQMSADPLAVSTGMTDPQRGMVIGWGSPESYFPR